MSNDKPNDVLNGSLTRTSKKYIESKAVAITTLRDKAVMLGLDPEEATVGEVIVVSILSSVANGNSTLAKELLDRIDGKAPDIVRNEITGEIKTSLGNLSDDQLRRILKNGGNK